MEKTVFLLKDQIKKLSKKLYKSRRILKEIQNNCEHQFDERLFRKMKEEKKVFYKICMKCGYKERVSEYAAIKR